VMDDVTMVMPRHAARLLGGILRDTRRRWAKSNGHYSLSMDAAWDSLEQLEYALPDEFHLDEP
jgi:hypothetical protein